MEKLVKTCRSALFLFLFVVFTKLFLYVLHQKKRKDIAAVSFPDRGKMLQKFKKSDINDNNDK